MFDANKSVQAVVLGRRFFIDLWGIMGIIPILCENPGEIASVLPELLSRRDIACVITEERWFNDIPLPLRKKLEDMVTPIWVSLPTLMIGEEGA